MLKNKHLRVATFFCPPYSYWNGSCQYDTRFNNNTCPEPDGIENILISILSEYLGFTYSLEDVSDRFDSKTPFDALLDATGSADLAYCGLWLTDFASRSGELDAAVLWNQQCTTFLVPEPQMIVSWRNILRTFETSTWFFILAVSVFFTLVAYKLCRFHITRIMGQKITRRDSISSFILGMLGVALGVSIPRTNAKYTSTPVRVLATTWSFSCLILIAFYTSNLGSFITVPFFEPKLEHIQDLLDQNFTWGMETKPNVSEILNLNSEAGRKFSMKFEIMDDLEEKLKSRKYAFPIFRSDDFFYVTSGEEPLFRYKDMRVMKQNQACTYSTLYMQKNLSVSAFLDIAILQLFGGGILKKIRRNVYERHDDSIHRISSKKYQNSGVTPWGLNHLLGPFTVLGFGWAISGCLFLLEKLIHRCYEFELYF